MKGADARFKKWVKDNELKYDSIILGSFHSYFTRLSGKPWYMIGYAVNPKLLAAAGKKITEESCTKLLVNPNTQTFNYEIIE